MLFLALLVMVLGAFVIVFLIFSLGPNLIVLFLVAVLIVWTVVRSYRDWAGNKTEKDDEERTHQKAGAAYGSFPLETITETLFHNN